MRSQCAASLLAAQSELRHGIAVYDDVDGNVSQSSGDWVARYRLIFDRPLPAASLSKPIVASEIRRLILAGKLSLDDAVVDELPSARKDIKDNAHAGIRIRQLLQHSAGFDRNLSGDALWMDDFPNPPQASCANAAELVLRRPLDFSAGQRVAYSNAGYCLLGQVLLAHGELSSRDRAFLESPLGAAGGWTSTPSDLHARLKQSLPLAHIDDAIALSDGSHYDYGWRHWPRTDEGPEWTHFGRLPGLLTLAVTDGQGKLLVAYFDGDPDDVDLSASTLSRDAWKCMRLSR